MKKTIHLAGIVTSTAVLAGLCVVTPAVGSFDQAQPGSAQATAELKPPRKQAPPRNSGGNSGAQQQQQRASQERAAQQRAAQERASQQRAAQERAAQQRASQERAAEQKAAQQRPSQERAAQERAAQDRAAQERASQDRASQQRAAEESAARRRTDDAGQDRQQDQQRAAQARAEQQTAADRLAQLRQDAARRQQQERDNSSQRTGQDEARSGGGNGPDRDVFERSRQDTAAQQGRSGEQTNSRSLQPDRDPNRSAAMEDMRKRLEAVRRDEGRTQSDRGNGDAMPQIGRSQQEGRAVAPPDSKNDDRAERDRGAANLLDGPDIRRDRDGDRETAPMRDDRDGSRESDDRDDGPRFRATPLAPGALQNNSGRGNAGDSSDRARADLDRAGQGGPSAGLPRSSDSPRGAIEGRDPRVFSTLDRNQRSVDLTRHSDHLRGGDHGSRSGPPSKLPLRRDADIDIHRHVDKSVHFHDHFHSRRVVVNHWAHHPRFVPRFRSHCDDDFAFLSFSTGSFAFGFSSGYSHWRPYRYCSPYSSYRVRYGYHHFAPVRYHYSYVYDDYCDWYYGSWYRPYVTVTKVVHHYDYSPAYRSYDDGFSYGSSSVLTSGGYDSYDNSGSSIFGDEVVEQPATIDEAWQLLVDGFLTEARELFVEIGTQYPFEGEPQIGYAIAAGLLHDDEAAAFAMRKALADQPEAIVVVPQNLAMQGHLGRLLDRWEESSRVEPSADAMFMIAALRFMLQDEATAYFAIDEAILAGDDDASTLNLKDVIRASMYETMYDE